MKSLIKAIGLFFVTSMSISVLHSQGIDHQDTSYLATVHLVNSASIEHHLKVLASDAYEGRETGEPGNDKAADYIARHLSDLGLQPIDQDQDFKQPFYVTKQQWQDVDLSSRGQTFKHLKDFIAPHWSNGALPDFNTGELYFVGYGIDDPQLSNYQKSDVTGKTLMMYAGEPMDKKGRYLLTGTDTAGIWSSTLHKLQVAFDKGAKAVLIIEPQFQTTLDRFRRFLVGPMIRPAKEAKSIPNQGYAMIDPRVAKTILGKHQKKAIKIRKKSAAGKSTRPKRIKQSLQMDFQPQVEQIMTQNVGGLLPGQREELSDEIIVVTAHYDHLGRRGDDIFNGADDNGTGTSALLAMASAMTSGHKLGVLHDRPVLFLWVSGEEKGLLGSEYYVENPLRPLDHHMVNVNVDMIGRRDEHHDDDNYIYVIGSDRLSTALHEANEVVNQRHEGLGLDYTYNAEDDPNRYYYRSDHYNFAKNNIPAVFFFSGVHPDYHRPSDTVDKINFKKTAKIGRHILHLIYELANREDKIEVNVK